MSLGNRLERAALRSIPRTARLRVRSLYMSARGVVEPEAYVIAAALSGGRALDVGANHGCYTRLLASACEAVEAFEPQPFCCDTIAAAGLPNVTLHREGLSDANGELGLHVPVKDGVPQTGWASFGPIEGDFETLTVPVRRLDDHGFTDVRCIKIDTEGHEMAVLAGARETVARERPLLLVEIMQCHLTDTSPAEEIASIESLGYVTAILDGSRVCTLAEARPATPPDNYIFVPAERSEMLSHLDAAARAVLARPAVAFATRRA